MLKLLFALAALSAPPPLAASEPDTPQVARIHYADLDLTGAPGKAVLNHRIKLALRDLCAGDQQLDLSKRLEEIRCIRAATAQIETQRVRVLANAARRTASRDTALLGRAPQPASSAD